MKNGIPPTNLYIKKNINSFFLNLSLRLLKRLENFALIISLKKKLAKIYKRVAPVDRPRTTIIVPNHFPKIKPPTKNIGEPNPSRRTQTIVQKKNIKLNRIILLFLISSRASLLAFINS